MAQAILADANIQGHLQALLMVPEGPSWREVWASLALPLFTFRDLGLAADAADAIVWQGPPRPGIRAGSGSWHHPTPRALSSASQGAR
jgi:hypothetical protein